MYKLITLTLVLTSCDEVIFTGKNDLKITRLGGKYKVEFNTKYCIGDYVEFNSPLNGSGKGTIIAVGTDSYGEYDYMIESKTEKSVINGVSYPVVSAGIYDKDITLIKKYS